MAKLHKLNKFTIVSNEWLKDKDLSLKAKGLLCVLQSLPDDWDFSVNGLVAIMPEGKDCILATIQELRDAGYLSWENIRDEHGKFDVSVTIHEKSITRKRESRDGFSATAEPTQYNKEIKETNNCNTNVLQLANADGNGVQKSSYGSEQINEAFEWWRQAFGYELKSSQQNRRAVYNMLRSKTKGEQWLKQMIALLVEAKRDKYSGIHIANFADLQRDWEKLMSWGSARYQQTKGDDDFERLVSQL